MKKILMLAALLCVTGLMAEDVVLKTWDLSKDNQRYSHKEKGVDIKTSCADGVFKIEVLQNSDKKGGNNVQFWCTYNTFKAGVKYRSDFSIKSSTDVNIAGTIMLTNQPWSSVVSKNVALKAGEATNVSIEFTMKEDTNVSYRTPGLFLGLAGTGTVYEISNVKLIEVK